MMNSPLENCEIRLRALDRTYSATLRRNERWWVGWIDDVPGVNAQAKTRGDLIENLGCALGEALEMR
jgi:predicted RNase H-like HicB family nuclease